MSNIIPQLSIISRNDESEHTFLPRNFQPTEEQLKSWYKTKDVICHCNNTPIRMHIKHRLDTDLYFLSTNPTSPKHASNCIFEHYRPEKVDGVDCQDSSSEPEELTGVVDLGVRSAIPSTNPSAEFDSSGTRANKIVKLIGALYEDSFTNYFHGRKIPFFRAVKGLQGASLAEELHQSDGTPISKSIFYGRKGLVFARQFVERSHSRGALWFEAADAIKIENGIVITNEFGTQHYPLEAEAKLPKTPGPYLVALHINYDESKGRSCLRKAYIFPVIDSQVYIPVRSTWHRDAATRLCRIVASGEPGRAFIGLPAKDLKSNHGSMPIIIVGLKEGQNRKRYLLSETPLSGDLLSQAQATYKASPISIHVAEHELLSHVT